jgi:hypothetical protein
LRRCFERFALQVRPPAKPARRRARRRDGLGSSAGQGDRLLLGAPDGPNGPGMASGSRGGGFGVGLPPEPLGSLAPLFQRRLRYLDTTRCCPGGSAREALGFGWAGRAPVRSIPRRRTSTRVNPSQAAWATFRSLITSCVWATVYPLSSCVRLAKPFCVSQILQARGC